MPYIRTEVKIGGVPTDGITVSIYDSSRFGAPPIQGTAPPAGAPDYTATSGGASGGSVGSVRVSVANYHDYYATYMQNGIQFWDGPIPALDPLIPENVIQGLIGDLASKATDANVMHLAGSETATGVKTFSTGLASQGLLDLSGEGNLTDLASSSPGSPNSGIGDRINLWGDGTNQYGIGIQASRVVIYMPSTSSLAVRSLPASGQKSSGTDAVVLGADGTITGKHRVAVGAVPTVVAGANNGTSPPAPTIAGNDARGNVQCGAGLAPTVGAQIVVTFATAYTVVPIIQLEPQNSLSKGLNEYVSSKSVNGFTVSTANAPTASSPAGTYSWDYTVIG